MMKQHNTPMKHILLADDDSELTALLSEYLSNHNIHCDIAENGQIALDKIQSAAYDLLVLDIMMPKVDGLTVLRELPANQLPVIMLTAKGDDIDRIIGLELGADDYISKPCNPRELLARIHAVTKRSKSTNQLPIETLPDSLLRLDTQQRSCQIGTETLSLTSTEFDLLYTLLKYKGQTVDKATLSEEVLQRDLQPFDRSIDVHISRLRKKLPQHQKDAIKSIRGKGYQLTI